MADNRPVSAIVRGQRRVFDRARDARDGTAYREVINAAPVVGLSRLATFPYCETRVDLDRRFDDIDRTGPLSHDRGETVGETGVDERMWERIDREDRLALAGMGFVLAAEEAVPPVFLVGRPDTVAFVDSRPEAVLVVSAGGGATPTAPEEFLAWLYCWQLDRVGFAVDGVTPAVVSTDPGVARSDRQELCQEVLRQADGPDLTDVRAADLPATVRPFEYDPGEWAETLTAALAYYRGERDPVPTRVATKCRRCEFADACPDSRV